MRYVLRPFLLVILVLVFAFPVVSYAQEQTAPVTIQGTPELEALVTAVRDAYVAANEGADVQITTEAGLSGGFEALCQGAADVVMSTEPITDAQIEACKSAGQDFIETVLAYEAVVLLPTPEAQLVCVSQDVLLNAWQLGAPAEMTWADLTSASLQTPVVFYGPEASTPIYQLFSRLVPAGDLRDDIVQNADVAEVLNKVQEAGSGAFGFMSLADLSGLDASITPLAVQDANQNCTEASLVSLAARAYPLARTDYLYVNANSVTRAEVMAFMNYVLTDGAATLAPAQGYTAAGADVYQTGLDYLTSARVGRSFTRPASPVSIAPDEAGTVSLAGTSLLLDTTTPVQQIFSSKFPAAQVDATLRGNTAGWQAFCSGEADVLQTTRDATDEEKALCDQNSIDPYTIDLGYEALVVAVPAGNDWIECMDADLAGRLFRAGSDETPAVTKWSDLNPEWPDTDIMLVLPPYGTGETDFLVMSMIKDLTFPFRVDAQVERSDALYRAQGVANTDNGITYLWWSDFQNSTADVKLLAMDGGQGCVAPSPETFADGTYPMAFPVRYLFSRASFDNALVRAFLWNFFDDASLASLGRNAYAGMDMTLLSGDQREAVFQMLLDYEAQMPAETVEPTPTAEATVEPTVEPTVEATAEPTVEPTVRGYHGTDGGTDIRTNG